MNALLVPHAGDLRARTARALLRAPGAAVFDPSRAAPRGDDDDLALEARVLQPAVLKPAAVLVPVIDRPHGLTVLFTLRRDDLNSHPGQIAFPGGRVDDSDDGPLAAALREAEEEVGLPAASAEPLGFLDAYQTGTGYRIVPVVALVDAAFMPRPAPAEVADVFEVPLAFLLDPANHQRDSAVWRGARRWFYVMPYGEHRIWGATAGMVRNLYERLA
jgi:8-oxo-dGTP pyrophosphatase MutT (NUDIX family)